MPKKREQQRANRSKNSQTNLNRTIDTKRFASGSTDTTFFTALNVMEDEIKRAGNIRKWQVLQQLDRAGISVADGTIRNYAKWGLVDKPDFKVYQEADTAPYAYETAAEVYAAYCLFNDKELRPTREFLVEVRALAVYIERAGYQHALDIIDDGQLLATIKGRRNLVYEAFEWLALKMHCMALNGIPTDLAGNFEVLHCIRDLFLGIAEFGPDYAEYWLCHRDLTKLDEEDKAFLIEHRIGETWRHSQEQQREFEGVKIEREASLTPGQKANIVINSKGIEILGKYGEEAKSEFFRRVNLVKVAEGTQKAAEYAKSYEVAYPYL